MESKPLLLFDIDGTLVKSGQKIEDKHAEILNKIKKKYIIGIVGGGEINKIIGQFDNKIFFNHYFSECGCVYHILDKNNNFVNIYKKNIREHKLYDKINLLIKKSLEFLSSVRYTLTGNFIDLRCGIIYISLIGLSANESEREYFKKIDNKENVRGKLINILIETSKKLNIENKISILEGGSVGISIFPVEYDKIQVLDKINNKTIYYFGDKYLPNGNDYKLLNHSRIIGFRINKIEDTYSFLEKLDT